MVTLTVEYSGSNGAAVDVYYDNGVLLKSFTDVDDGDWLMVDATWLPGITKLRADTRFYVNGGPETKIHTSCSKYILGMVINEFTVIGWTDGTGNTCDESVPLVESCDCDGGMIELSVRYNGAPGVTVTAEYDAGIVLDEFTNVQDGDILTVISWTIDENKLKSETEFFINGDSEANFHTSCSQSIMDQTIGAFTVVGWLDADGQYCGFTDQDAGGLPGSSITRTWTATDASGNSSSCVQLITIVDDTPPVITCPADMTIDCEEDSSPANTGLAVAADDCSDPEITFTDVVNVLPPPPEFSCSCDGGMVTLTVEYNGPDAAATVDVFYDTGVPLATFTDVQPGQSLMVDARWLTGITKLKNDTRFYVNGGPEIKIHTSCSKYILGMEVGPFTVLGWTDGTDNVCDDTVPLIESCACDGGMIELSVRYNGTSGVTVTAEYESGTSLGEFTNVQDGDIITVISWAADKTKLKRDTKFYVNGGPERKFHTSCSDDIMDQTVGEFTVVGWLDADGQYCGFSPESGSGPCSDTEITRTWTATDAAGNVSSCTQIILIIDLSPSARIGADVASVQIAPESKVGSEILHPFPNPASDKVTMTFSSYEEKTVRIFDRSGKIVYNIVLDEGTQLIQVNTTEFADGVYVIQIDSDENDVIRDKFIIAH